MYMYVKINALRFFIRKQFILFFLKFVPCSTCASFYKNRAKSGEAMSHNALLFNYALIRTHWPIKKNTWREEKLTNRILSAEK